MSQEATSTRRLERLPRVRDMENLNMYDRRNWARIVQDIELTLRQCPSLVPSIGVLHFHDGRQQRLLVLRGTVPIFFRHTQYNVPMDFWLPASYPAEPPVLYVTPTRQMFIVPGHRHVDRSGRVYMPGLLTWNANESRLHFIVAEVSSLFSTRPPVYSFPSVTTPLSRASSDQEPPPLSSSSSSQTVSELVTHTRRSVEPEPVPNQRRTDLRQRILERARMRFTAEFGRLTEIQLEMEQETEAIAQLSGDHSASDDQQAKNTLSEEAASLASERARVKNDLETIQKTVRAIDEWIASHTELERDPDIETILESTDVHSHTLSEARATDAAIHDAQQLLEDMLRRERVEIDIFLRLMRELAYRQFFVRRLLRRLDGNA
jgi:ESCRT-I complex subunit TSG101